MEKQEIDFDFELATLKGMREFRDILDEIKRQIMRLEIEKESIKKEKDERRIR